VRWTGSIVPQYSEKYTFYANSDDGVRLWIKGQKILENWSDHSAEEVSGTIDLKAGVSYPIKVEYYDNIKRSLITIKWKSESQPKQIISQKRLFL
jgi:hypothetical protein